MIQELSPKIDQNFSLIMKIHNEKFNDIIQSINQLNVSNGGKIENPLIKSIEELSANVKNNLSLDISDYYNEKPQ